MSTFIIRRGLRHLIAALILVQGLLATTATSDDSNAKSRKPVAKRGAKELAKNTNPVVPPVARKHAYHAPGDVTLSTGETVRPTANDVPGAKVRRYAKEIDRLVDSQLTKNRVKPARLASDEVFVRRVYLDIVGRIPTLTETNAFLSSKHKRRRADLIDELLDSYGHVSRQFNFWADVLRTKTDLRNIAGQPYVDFVKDSISENKPYDEFVSEMLTASGPSLQRGNGAVGYYLRDNNMQEDNMSNTVRVFLGTRLECAQCHDHPFDVWTQRDYYEMVAFTGGIQYRQNPIDSEHAKKVGKLRQDKSMNQQERQAIRKIIEPMTYGISGSGNGLARLPEDYEAGDGEPHEIVTAKTMFEKQSLVDAKVPTNKPRKARKRQNAKKYPQRINNAPELDSREQYADWMTSPDNPRFTTVIANRMWKQAMGLGLIEPVDTLTAETKASNPELMEYLQSLMLELDYDLKQFMRAIYNSEVYQRVADSSSVTNPDKHSFNGPLVRRLQAEQIWDSLLTLAIPEIDKRSSQPAGRALRYMPVKDIYEGYERLRKLDVDEVKQLADAFAARRNGNRSAMMEAMSDVFDAKEIAEPKFKQVAKQIADLNERSKRAKKNKNYALMKKLANQRRELQARQKMARMSGDLKRASELPSPAKPGHFLREFGQSDREQIDNANQEPAVTQSLSLMNGMVEKNITRFPYSVLMKNVQASASPRDKVDTAYLSMLNRRPKPYETTEWVEAIQSDGEVAISDLIWSLANSVEFLFNK